MKEIYVFTYGTLKRGFSNNHFLNDAIFISIGANVGQSPRIEGAEFKGVYSANAFLENKKHSSYKGKNVAVIGGGNVAIDTARTMKKLGADKVVVIYRRPEDQMPASKEEIK